MEYLASASIVKRVLNTILSRSSKTTERKAAQEYHDRLKAELDEVRGAVRAIFTRVLGGARKG